MKALKYSDIVLVPNYSECTTRSDCDVSVEIAGKKFRLPIIPANMKSVINEQLAKWMSDNDLFYIMHRFDIDIVEFVRRCNEQSWKNISISVGVKEHDEKIIEAIAELKYRVDFITVDIAHGYSRSMCDMLQFIREKLGDSVRVIAGNVATRDAVVALNKWGADIVKLGIGQGSPCTTKDKTGFTVPMFTCVRKCHQCYASQEEFDAGKRIPVIADGGVACNGDIAKALVAGADLVMAGGLFASCIDSPADVIMVDNMACKGYFGSASFQNKGHRNHIEGKLNKMESNGMSYEKKFEEITQDLQSAVSYAGGGDLSSFNKVGHLEV